MAEAYWAHKDGVIHEVSEHNTFARQHSDVMKLSKREIAQADKSPDPRTALILTLTKKGWIRARRHRIGAGYEMWTFEVWGLDQSALGTILEVLTLERATPEEQLRINDLKTGKGKLYEMRELMEGAIEREMVANPKNDDDEDYDDNDLNDFQDNELGRWTIQHVMGNPTQDWGFGTFKPKKYDYKSNPYDAPEAKGGSYAQVFIGLSSGENFGPRGQWQYTVDNLIDWLAKNNINSSVIAQKGVWDKTPEDSAQVLIIAGEKESLRAFTRRIEPLIALMAEHFKQDVVIYTLYWGGNIVISRQLNWRPGTVGKTGWPFQKTHRS